MNKTSSNFDFKDELLKRFVGERFIDGNVDARLFPPTYAKRYKLDYSAFPAIVDKNELLSSTLAPFDYFKCGAYLISATKKMIIVFDLFGAPVHYYDSIYDVTNNKKRKFTQIESFVVINSRAFIMEKAQNTKDAPSFLISNILMNKDDTNELVIIHNEPITPLKPPHLYSSCRLSINHDNAILFGGWEEVVWGSGTNAPDYYKSLIYVCWKFDPQTNRMNWTKKYNAFGTGNIFDNKELQDLRTNFNHISLRVEVQLYTDEQNVTKMFFCFSRYWVTSPNIKHEHNGTYFFINNFVGTRATILRYKDFSSARAYFCIVPKTETVYMSALYDTVHYVSPSGNKRLGVGGGILCYDYEAQILIISHRGSTRYYIKEQNSSAFVDINDPNYFDPTSVLCCRENNMLVWYIVKQKFDKGMIGEIHKCLVAHDGSSPNSSPYFWSSYNNTLQFFNFQRLQFVDDKNGIIGDTNIKDYGFHDRLTLFKGTLDLNSMIGLKTHKLRIVNNTNHAAISVDKVFEKTNHEKVTIDMSVGFNSYNDTKNELNEEHSIFLNSLIHYDSKPFQFAQIKRFNVFFEDGSYKSIDTTNFAWIVDYMQNTAIKKVPIYFKNPHAKKPTSLQLVDEGNRVLVDYEFDPNIDMQQVFHFQFKIYFKD